MKYFDFYKLHDMAESYHFRYFPFYELKRSLETIENTVLLAILLWLVYLWVKLFLYFDRNTW